MAKTKAKGTTKGSRKAIAKCLGLKKSGGQKVAPGEIIIRQRGTKFHPAEGVKMGRDYTIFAIRSGRVKFQEKYKNKIVSVE